MYCNLFNVIAKYFKLYHWNYIFAWKNIYRDLRNVRINLLFNVKFYCRKYFLLQNRTHFIKRKENLSFYFKIVTSHVWRYAINFVTFVAYFISNLVLFNWKCDLLIIFLKIYYTFFKSSLRFFFERHIMDFFNESRIDK